MNKGNNFSATANFILEDIEINFKQLEYSIIEYSTPAYTLNPVFLNRQDMQGSVPGDRIIKEQATVLRFVLDEQLEVFFSLLHLQQRNLKLGYSRDLLNLHILNNMRKPIAIGTYKNAWITNISPIRYTTNENETIAFLDVNLNYLDFEINPL